MCPTRPVARRRSGPERESNVAYGFRGFPGRLRDRGGRIRRLRSRGALVGGSWVQGCLARGRRGRPSPAQSSPIPVQPHDPRANRLRAHAEGSQGQLAVPDGAGPWQQEPRPPLAARQGARRLVLHQRHALRARTKGGLRRLAATRCDGLVLGRRRTLLSQCGTSGTQELDGRRAPRHRRSAQRRRHGAACRVGSGDHRLHPGRPATPRRPQRRRPGGRRLVPGHPEARSPVVRRRGLSSSGDAAAQPSCLHAGYTQSASCSKARVPWGSPSGATGRRPTCGPAAR